MVTAQKRVESAQTVPIAISVFSGKALSERAVGNVSQLTAVASNVNFDNGVPFTGSTAVLAASICGIGGAVSIVTRDPVKEFRLRGDITKGRIGMTEARGSVDIPITDRLTLLVTFDVKTRQGYSQRVPFPGALANNSPAYTAYPHVGYESPGMEGRAINNAICSKLKYDGGNFRATVGGVLPKTPEWKFNIGPRVDLPLGKGKISLLGDYTYTSSMRNNVEGTVALNRGATSVVNASMIYTAPEEKYTITVGGTNLTNARYVTAGSSIPASGVIAGSYSRPVEWYVRLGFKY